MKIGIILLVVGILLIATPLGFILIGLGFLFLAWHFFQKAKKGNKQADLLEGINFTDNELNEKSKKHGEQQKQSYSHFEQALKLFKEEKEFFPLLQQSAQEKIKAEQLSDVLEGLKIVNCGKDACDECKKLKNKKYSFIEALEQMPIPVKNCQTFKGKNGGWCRCYWEGIIKKD